MSTNYERMIEMSKYHADMKDVRTYIHTYKSALYDCIRTAASHPPCTNTDLLAIRLCYLNILSAITQAPADQRSLVAGSYLIWLDEYNCFEAHPAKFVTEYF